jgi:hypothetical protein
MMPLGTKVLSHSLYLLQNAGVEGKRQSLYAERDAAREERERPIKQAMVGRGPKGRKNGAVKN